MTAASPPPGISAGAGALGGAVIGAVASGVGQYFANKSSKKAARTQRKWQQRQSNRVYQKTMGDMKRAGLNPILAGQVGGNSAKSGSVSLPTIRNVAEGAANTALGGKRLTEEMKLMQANVQNILKTTEHTAADIVVKGKQVDLLEQQARTGAAQESGIKIQNALATTLMPGALAEQEIDQGWYGKAMRYINRAGGAVWGTGRKAFRPREK